MKMRGLLVGLLVLCAVLGISGTVAACYSFKVDCEGASTGWWAGDYGGQLYASCTPADQNIMAGDHYKYHIQVFASGGCEQSGIDLKLQMITLNFPGSGWGATLTDPGGSSVDGIEQFWAKSQWATPKDYYLDVTSPSGANPGDTAKVTVRVWSNGTNPANEHCIGDIFTTTIIGGIPELDHVTITPSSSTLIIGQTQNFQAQAYDASNTPLSGATYAWSVTGGIGTVNPTSGQTTTFTATTAGSGSVDVSATFGGNTRTASATVTVTPPPNPLDHVVISPKTANVVEGNTQDFSAIAYDTSSSPMSGVTFAWTVTGVIGTVNPTSGSTSTTFTATTAGTGNVTATATVNGITKYDDASVTVAPKPHLDHVVVTSSVTPFVVIVGQSAQLTAQAYDNNNQPMSSGIVYLWWTDNNGYGTMTTGMGPTTTFTATTVGSGTMTAVTCSDETGNINIEGTIDITVNPIPITCSVTPAQTTVVSGGSVQVTVLAKDNLNNPLQDAEVQMESDKGGSFSISSDMTDSDGKFITLFTTPLVSSETVVTITATVSKPNYQSAVETAGITVSPVFPNLQVNVGDITFSVKEPKKGESLTITAKIWNAGEATANNVKVRFYDGDPTSGGTQIGEDQAISSLDKNVGSTAQVPWTPQKEGQHKIKVVVDPDNELQETNENDNSAQTTIDVAAAPPPSNTPGQGQGNTGPLGFKVAGIPWWVILIVVVLIVGILAVAIAFKKRKKQPQPQWPQQYAPQPQQLPPEPQQPPPEPQQP